VTDDLAAAWDELHDAKPDDRPAELRRRPQAVGPVRLWPARACIGQPPQPRVDGDRSVLGRGRRL